MEHELIMNIIANGPGELEQYVEEHFIDKNGLLYSMIDSSTGAPTTEDTFRGNTGSSWPDWKVEGFTKSEFACYENYGMVNGAFASAMLLKYKLTGDQSALERARRAFRGIRHVVEIGKELEFGFLPKIYGDRFTMETSTDQYLYILNAWDEYRRMEECSQSERKEIEELIIAAVEFWRKRNYHFTYFIYENMKWPPLRFPSFLALAYNVSGDKTYLEEAENILRENASMMPENSRFSDRHLNETELKTRDKLIYGMPDGVSMDTLNATLYLRNHPTSGFADIWRSCMITMYLEGIRTIAEDGQAYTSMYHNLTTGKLRQADVIGDKSLHGARTGWSTMILRGCLQMAQVNSAFKAEVIAHARRILSSFDHINKFNYIAPEDADRLPVEYQFKSRFLSGDSISHGLWSYYLLMELERKA